MKYILSIAFLFALTFQASAQEKTEAAEVNWLTLEEAQKLSKKDGKPIMIDVHTVWCGPCKLLTKITFKDPKVVAYLNENFHSVKFNAEGNETVKFNGVTYENPNYNPENANRRNSVHQLAYKLDIKAYPTIVFVDKKGEIIHTALGYQDQNGMMEILNKVLSKAGK